MKNKISREERTTLYEAIFGEKPPHQVKSKGSDKKVYSNAPASLYLLGSASVIVAGFITNTKVELLLKKMETEARLATLDDCKTLLERVLSESKLADDKSYTGKDRLSLLIQKKTWDKELAELEALKLKYLKAKQP